jgi:hypothetical protein
MQQGKFTLKLSFLFPTSTLAIGLYKKAILNEPPRRRDSGVSLGKFY